MKLLRILKSVWSQNPIDLMRFMRDWQAWVRMHFLYAALESGLLAALRHPRSKEELAHQLGVERPDLLDALLDVGLSLGELTCKKGQYSLKGSRSRSLLQARGDVLAALVQANATYYNSVYRHFGDRLQGAPLGDYLEEIGDVVARLSKLAEPFVREFIRDAVAGQGPMRILDVGCGSGIYLQAAVQANPDVAGAGLEVDPSVVDQARQNLQEWGLADRFEVIQGDVRVPPPGLTGSFDLVSLYNVIYYFPLEERLGLFRSIRKMLSPGGALALVSSMQSKGQDLASAHLNLATSSMVGCTPLPNLEELTAQLKESGLAQIHSSRLMPRSAVYGIVARQG